MDSLKILSPTYRLDLTTSASSALQLIPDTPTLAFRVAILNTGTDDARIVTPLKLKTNLATYKYAANVSVTTAGNYTVTHNLGTTDVVVRVADSNAETVLCDVTATSANVVTYSLRLKASLI